MKFSHRFGFDPDYKNEPIRHDAPKWLKSMFFLKILEPLLYVDGDSRVKNEDKKPLGVKSLIERLCAKNGQETDHEDFDSWTCWDALKFRVQALEWYQFYDAVEIIGEMIKTNEYQYSDIWDYNDYEAFMFMSYRQKVNDLFSQHKVQWKLSESGRLESSLPRDLEVRVQQTDNQLKDHFKPARKHYAKARAYILSPSTDPENSIKESVSAVESVCKAIYPKTATLGDALKAMKKEQIISPMLITVFEKFYAYTNSEPAVRHGSHKESKAK
jgi:hypothetical protein